jgi:hypothetical protein
LPGGFASAKKYVTPQLGLTILSEAVILILFALGIASVPLTAVLVIGLAFIWTIYLRRRQMSQESSDRIAAIIKRLVRLVEQVGTVTGNQGAVDLLGKVGFDKDTSTLTQKEGRVLMAEIRDAFRLFQAWQTSVKEGALVLRETYTPNMNSYYITRAINDLIFLYDFYLDLICNKTVRLANEAPTKSPDLWNSFESLRGNMYELRGAINPFLTDCAEAGLSPVKTQVNPWSAHLDPMQKPATIG